MPQGLGSSRCSVIIEGGSWVVGILLVLSGRGTKKRKAKVLHEQLSKPKWRRLKEVSHTNCTLASDTFLASIKVNFNAPTLQLSVSFRLSGTMERRAAGSQRQGHLFLFFSAPFFLLLVLLLSEASLIIGQSPSIHIAAQLNLADRSDRWISTSFFGNIYSFLSSTTLWWGPINPNSIALYGVRVISELFPSPYLKSSKDPWWFGSAARDNHRICLWSTKRTQRRFVYVVFWQSPRQQPRLRRFGYTRQFLGSLSVLGPSRASGD